MSYLLDANVFIQAKNLHYGLDFCPAFWQWLIDGHADGRVFSIDKVADEIAAGADELTSGCTTTAMACSAKRIPLWPPSSAR